MAISGSVMTDADHASKHTRIQAHVNDIAPHPAFHSESRIKSWILVRGDRLHVTGLLLAVVFTTLFLLNFSNTTAMMNLFTETGTLTTLFNTFLGGIILLVSIVVSINSIVVTQEIASLGTQQERIQQSHEFREQLQELTGDYEHAMNPAGFLNAFLQAVSVCSERLDKAASKQEHEQFAEKLQSYVDNIQSTITGMNGRFEDGDASLFEVLLTGLSYDYSEQIEATQQLRNDFAETVSEETLVLLEDLIQTLQVFAIGHQHFKTLYYKHELSTLSQMLLYTSLPAILFGAYTTLSIEAGLIPDISFFNIYPLLLFIDLAFTVVLIPFVLLTSYILRVATITKRTLTAGPLHVRRGKPTSVEWDFIE